MNKETVSNFIKKGARFSVLTSFLILSGCSIDQTEKVAPPTPTVLPVPTRVLPPTPTVVLENYSLLETSLKFIGKVFPDYSKNGLVEKAVYRISTKSSIPTWIFNYTDYQPNIKVIAATYDLLDSIPEEPVDKNIWHLMEYKYNDTEERKLFFKKPENLKNRIMMIVPESYPRHDSEDTTEGTTWIYKDVAISTVRARSEGIDLRETAAIAVEGCQESLNAESLKFNRHDKDNEKPVDVYDVMISESHVAQETGCNSLGIAISSKFDRRPYVDYKKSVEGVQMKIVSATLGFVSENAYDSIPELDKALS